MSQSVTIDIINEGALRLLYDMEHLHLIRFRADDKAKQKSQQKLSERFAGSLHLSDEQYEEFQSAIKKGRDEVVKVTIALSGKVKSNFRMQSLPQLRFSTT
jgi:hypothetical protein